MARYIDADALLETLNGLYNQHLTMRNYAADGATADCIEAVIVAPTADVVPKSEVAREIFEDFEAKAPWFCENQTAYEHFNEELAELKKKYTNN